MIILDGLAWLSMLVALVGVAVCGIHLGRVRWAGVLAAGFALHAVGLFFGRVLVLLARHGTVAGTRAGFVLAGLVGILGSAAVVAGVALLLRETVRTQQDSSGGA